MRVIRRPIEDRTYLARLMTRSTEVENDTWFDLEGCHEGRITIWGMGDGDKLGIRVANTVERPLEGQGVYLAKPYTKDLEVKLSRYKWVRAEHLEAGHGSVTVDFYGWN